MKRVLLSALSMGLLLTFSCQTDNLEEVNPAQTDGISLNDASAAGGNGNGNAYGLLRNCASHDVLARKLADNPGLAKKMEEIESHARAFISAKNGQGGGKPGGGGGSTPTPYTGEVSIPVIVNVIYNTTQQNISDQQIASQISVLNEDFNKTNSEISSIPAEFAGLAANTNIKFTLAKVNRKQSSRTEWGTRDDMKFTSRGGIDVEDPANYLNIWVCNIGGGILGYAQFPGGNASTDGVVVGPQFFGNTGYVQAPFDKGRTATHEVGHWLNLRHIWGDGRCQQDDYVADTPASDRANYGCPSYPTVHCRSNDMTMNYMDYTDDACMYMFSNGQNDRMRALFASGGARETLVQ
ncbi:MAG: zinc metalloprotease [Bacteroidetes bacterium]|nr:zinc metalloprotease [Bacteroidota bacterium]